MIYARFGQACTGTDMHTIVYSIYGLYIHAAARTCIVHKIRRRMRLIQFWPLAHYTYALWHIEFIYTCIYQIYGLYREGLFYTMFNCRKFTKYISCTLHIRTVWHTQYITHTPCCTRTGFRFRLDATLVASTSSSSVRVRKCYSIVCLTN